MDNFNFAWEPPPDTVMQREFETVKTAVLEQDINTLVNRVTGFCTVWGELLFQAATGTLKEGEEEKTYANMDLASRLALYFFWGTAAGEGLAPDMHPNDIFSAALLYAPFSSLLVKDWTLGPLKERTEKGELIYSVTEKRDQDIELTVERDEDGTWLFDLMPLYQASSLMLGAYIADRHDGDFDSFLDGELEGRIDMQKVKACEAVMGSKVHG